MNQTGKARITRLLGESVAYIVKRLHQAAGVDHISPHDLRRSTVTHLLDAGVDVLTVQKLAGHADASTTARYDRRGEHAKRRAVRQLSIPLPGCGLTFPGWRPALVNARIGRWPMKNTSRS